MISGIIKKIFSKASSGLLATRILILCVFLLLIISTAFTVAELRSDFRRMLTAAIIMGISIILASVVVSLIFSKVIIKPLKIVVAMLQDISKNWNLTRRIDFKNIDRIAEISEISRIFNLTFDSLENLVDVTKNKLLILSNTVYELSSSSMEISTTANEQSASVAEIVSTMENNKNLAEQVAKKTIEVADLAEETQEISLRGASLRDANENMMLDILNQNTKIIDIIKNLADMLSRIDESIQLIDSIADQTKLIAFNAALEASSSGEAGARFSVVAGEIRRFADNVVESSSEIKERIAELHEASQSLITEANNGSKAINSGYERMVVQKEVFKNIVEVSQNVANRSQQISSLSKQQELASAQVFSALKEISSGVNHFVSATFQTSETVEKLNSMSIELKDTLAKYHTADRSKT